MRRIKPPLDGFVSDPVIYNGRSSNSYVNVGGRFALTSNGRRLTLAHLGAPLQYYQAKKGYAQEGSIREHEDTHNQFTDRELTNWTAHPIYGSSTPYQHQVDLFVDTYLAIRKQAIQDLNAARFNGLNLPKNTKPNVIEVYVEFSDVTQEDHQLESAFRKVLGLCFGQPDTHRIENSKDKADRDAILAWIVHPNMISPRFVKTKKSNFKVKLYRKGTRLRLEIQANSPSIKLEYKSEKEKAWARTARESYILPQFFKLTFRAIADELAFKLRQIERHAVQVLFANPSPDHDWKLRFNRIMERTAVIAPRLSKTVGFIKFAERLARQCYIDRKELSLFIGVQNLKTLANEEIGYLVAQDKGVNGLSGKYTRGSRNPTFMLKDELLKRTDRLAKEKKPREVSDRVLAMRSLTKRFATKPADRYAEMLQALEGSANPNSSLLKLLRKSAS